MNVIYFFLFSFLTVFLSIKLSVYADRLSASGKVNKAFIGGVLLAGITCLPEFVTCISSVIVDNPSLAFGDILGSNIFNIFIICFFDIIFIKNSIFNSVSKNIKNVYILLLINYVFILLFLINIFDLYFLIALPSLVIFITYGFYLYFISKKDITETSNIDCNIKNLWGKIIINAIFMVISSILLTITVNSISVSYPSFSSSLIGAVLLGITTSLPEVITFYTLVVINSYDLALSNIIGSNLFNLFVLAITDVILYKYPIYVFSDDKTFFMAVIVIIITFINLFQVIKNKVINKILYIIPSLLVILIYLFFWINGFILK